MARVAIGEAQEAPNGAGALRPEEAVEADRKGRARGIQAGEGVEGPGRADGRHRWPERTRLSCGVDPEAQPRPGLDRDFVGLEWAGAGGRGLRRRAARQDQG